ncbi:DMP19 family protein [Sporosarcina koreensis]|uniref:DMP19 family protein n=1 Tax=Sporosarcina koreensis TaxID=334735 RepID=UPI00058C072B|nr:hypothetical protein [Sporosarcina koreensis]
MKPTMNRNELLDNESIWNAVVSVLSEADLPEDDPVMREAFLLYHYYSEMESGGHEGLLTWFGDEISEMGIGSYVQQLADALAIIGAEEYAVIEKTYGPELWRLFISLEGNDRAEEEFYEVAEQADGAYHALEAKLEQRLETYFTQIHTAVIDVTEP